jgi:hypothetical protein
MKRRGNYRKIDYVIIDKYINENPDNRYKSFKIDHPDFQVSDVTFQKRRKKLLNRPTAVGTRASSKAYSSLASFPLEDIKTDGIKAIHAIAEAVAKIGIDLEAVIITKMEKQEDGSDPKPYVEIRRHTR